MNPPSQSEVESLSDQIDLIPELSGAGIGFVGGDECIVLRAPGHSSGLKTYVVLQEGEDAPPPPADVPPPPSLLMELAGIGINCTGAFLAWGALAGEGIAAPATGGATAVLTPITYLAAISTSAQCGLSIIRASDIYFNDGNWSRWLDSQDFYPWATGALDAISLAGAAISASAAIRAAQAIRRATGQSWTVILKGLSRAERKRLAEELIKLEKPGISNRALKELVRAGTFPGRLKSAEVSKRLFLQLKDAISATLSFGGSATSGLIKLLYVHIVQE